MHQQSWQDLWSLFLAVMASEPIHIRVGIGMALVFLAVMSLTGMADSFLPRRAARRYAAMYDMMPAVSEPAVEPQGFQFVPPDAALPLAMEEAPDDPERPSASMAAMRRSMPQPPKVLRSQKP